MCTSAFLGRMVYNSFVFIGSARKLELRIRLFCRSVLLDHWTHQSDSAFWLTRILKPWPMVNQARLLYIIFGPISPQDGEHTFFRDVCYKTLITSTLGNISFCTCSVSSFLMIKLCFMIS